MDIESFMDNLAKRDDVRIRRVKVAKINRNYRRTLTKRSDH